MVLFKGSIVGHINDADHFLCLHLLNLQKTDIEPLIIFLALGRKGSFLNINFFYRYQLDFIKIDAVFRSHHFVIRSYEVLMKFKVLFRLDKFLIGLLSPTDLLKLNNVQSRIEGRLDHVEQHVVVYNDNLVRFEMPDHFFISVKAK